MVDEIEEHNQKHQQNRSQKLEQRHQKQEENETSVKTTEEKTITNICYDCLERIFDFSDLKSLLNVADTCKRLQIAAITKFGDKFGKRKFMLDLQTGYERAQISIRMYLDEITIIF